MTSSKESLLSIIDTLSANCADFLDAADVTLINDDLTDHVYRELSHYMVQISRLLLDLAKLRRTIE